MIQITSEIAIDENDIQFDFVRASGPGGQNVNKVATAVQLRFDLNKISIPDDMHERLVRLAGQRLSDDGTLIIEARQFRSQEKNRRDAVERLIALLRRAAEKPKPRRKTKPSSATRQRRLSAKRRRADIKRLRSSVNRHDE